MCLKIYIEPISMGTYAKRNVRGIENEGEIVK